MNKILLFSGVLIGSSLLNACSTKMNPPEVSSPASEYATVIINADQLIVFEQWWRQFNDPLLDSLVEQARSENLDIKKAIARVDAARALRSISSSGFLPQVNWGASASRQRISAYQAGFQEPLNTAPVGTEFTASWELDVFGRVRESVRAADADANAADADAHWVQVAMTAEVVRTYLGIRGLERQIAIVGQSAESQNDTLDYSRRLYEAGAAAVADVDRAASQAALTSSQLPDLKLQWQQAVNRLAVLVNSTPKSMYEQLGRTPAAKLTEVRHLGPGTPAAMLRHRPDVMAAEARLVGAYARLGVAKADLMPRLSLSGALGSLIDGLVAADVAKSAVWALGAQASFPVFDGGLRRGGVALRDAQAQEAFYDYRLTMLNAISDVESALAATQRSTEREIILGRAATSAKAASEQIRQSWKAGESPFLDVLEAQRVQLAAENELSQIRTAKLRSQATLITTLGG